MLDTANIVLSELLSVSHYIGPAELVRAQNMLKSMLAMNLESLPLICEDICRFDFFESFPLPCEQNCLIHRAGLYTKNVLHTDYRQLWLY